MLPESAEAWTGKEGNAFVFKKCSGDCNQMLQQKIISGVHGDSPHDFLGTCDIV